MPVLPSSLIEPLWQQFATLLPARPTVDPTHPLGCHRRRIGDRVVFEHVIAALVHGSGLERIASIGCSDRTIRRRLAEWADLGIGQQTFTATLAAYEKMIGLDLADVAVDGCITKAVGGGECTGRSPVDRGKGGTKRSVLVDALGVPLHVQVAAANCHDSPLLAPTLAGLQQLGPLPEHVTVHLDAGYDSRVTRALLADLGLGGRIATKGVKAPVQVGKRWVVERTHAWLNGFGKLRRLTDRDRGVAEFYTHLAAAITVIRRLINEARHRYRWATRPTTRRLR
ncbi:IS5 family transposase [Kineococcus arenarius]|uniref:IS5 family transposase n=1 Tax=unclassified Kineococcus TaxID=2621656 RepID=UPI003D7C8C4B